MYLQCYEEVKQLTKELVKIPSVVKSSGEAKCAEKIYDYYNQLEYFKENPSNCVIQALEDTTIVLMAFAMLPEGYKTLRHGEKLCRLLAAKYLLIFTDKIQSIYTKSPN